MRSASGSVSRPARRARRRTLAVAATIAALGVAAAGCSNEVVSQGTTAPSGRVNSGIVESDGPANVGGSIAYGLAAETNGWNPSTNQFGPSGWQVARTFFDNLVSYDSANVAQADAAKAIEHNDDFTTWTVTLRPGINYSNGKPADAASVAKAQNLLRSSPVTGPGYKQIDKIEAAGADKVVFTMSRPWVNFPTLLATQVGVVADPDWLGTNDGLHPVGTGAFTLDSWAVGDRLVVVKNPSYWRSDPKGVRYPYLDKVTFRVMTDGSSRSSALEAGDIDAAEIMEPATIKHFQEAGDTYQLFTDSKSEMTEYFVMLNTQVAPFDDVDARRALAYATDRQGFVDTVEAGLFEPADGPFAKNSPWYDPQNGYPAYDPAKAKELVDAVKARHGGTFQITLSGPNNSDNTVSLQLLQQMYANVGIDVKVQTVEPATSIIDAVAGSYQAMLFGGWFYAHPDEEMAFIDPRTAYAPPQFTLNLTRNNDMGLAPLIDTWRATADPADQKKAMADIVRRINQDSAYIWLYHSQVAIVANRHLVNLTNYTLPDGQKGLDLREGSHPLFQVWVQS